MSQENTSLRPGSREAARYALTDAALWRDRVFSHNFVRTSYNRIFRRNSTFVTSILVGAIGAEIFFDGVTNWVYGSLNRGKSWEDLEAQLKLRQ